MNDKEIVEYTKKLIVSNLAQYDLYREIAEVKCDNTNKVLLAHIKGLIELFKKAEEILESDSNE